MILITFSQEEPEDFIRIVVAIDPAVTSNINSDETGIIVAGVDGNNNYYILDGRDSMNHVMNGNIGLFIQQAYRVIANYVLIDTIKNYSMRNPRSPVVIRNEEDGDMAIMRRRTNDARLKHNRSK